MIGGRSTSAILGLDAAWTDRQPSGVALVREQGERWRCVAVAPSYESFMAGEPGQAIDWEQEPVPGPPPDPGDLLRQASRLLGGGEVTVVTMDLPLAYSPIMGRRQADNEVSRAFGAAWCGTHSPTPDRPGRLSGELRAGLEAEGYELATKTTEGGAPGVLLEVYPHVALLGLLGVSQRVACKVGKTRRYWPRAPLAERLKLLLEVQHQILDALGHHIDGIDLPLPDHDEPGTLSGLKRFEDGLDALLCCWVGIRYLEGEAVAYGDRDAAIWVPKQSLTVVGSALGGGLGASA